MLLSSDAQAGSWTKSLKLSASFNGAVTRIYVDHKLIEKRTLNLGLHLDGALNSIGRSHLWKNSLKIDYAGAKTSDESDPSNNSSWAETSDQFIADSYYRRKGVLFIDPYAAVNVQTRVSDSGYQGEWRAFKPLQTRESAGFSLPLRSTNGTDFDIRVGYFRQHFLNQDHQRRPITHGVESVIEFDGGLAKNISLKSKAGLYTDLDQTDDFDDPTAQSYKQVLEWDNQLTVDISKFLSIDIILNVDNKNVGSQRIAYEIDHQTALSLNWNIF